MSWWGDVANAIAQSQKYIQQSSQYITDTAVKNVNTAGAAISQAGGVLTKTVSSNKDLQNSIAGSVANGVATQNAQDAQTAATTLAQQQVAAAKADTLAKQDNDLRSQAKAAYGGLAGNILTSGRGAAGAAVNASRVLLGS